MTTPPLSDDILQEAVLIRAAAGSDREAAEALGIARSSLQNRLKRAAERGLMGVAPVLPGFRISQISNTPNGDFIQQKPERGEAWTLPEGHSIKGVSALVDADGRTVQSWVKTAADSVKANNLRDAILAVFADHSAAVLPDPPAFTDADTMTVYPIVDLHLGLYAWARETGADYDVDISAGLLRAAVSNLVSRSAASETAIVLDLGDYFHADDSRNQTKRSGNPLDVDTRYARVLQVGYELVVETIELALQKHAKVIYRKLPGNHDDETSLMLAISIAAHFRNEPRVSVDTDPSRFFIHRFGKVMIGATHGDQLKKDDMAGFMSTNYPEEWGQTRFRHGFTGHIHHDTAKVRNGVKVESFNTLAAKDAWHAGMGFSSPRTAVSITMHRDYGEIDRFTVSLPMLQRAAANDNELLKAAA
jgi:hypothetical protein